MQVLKMKIRANKRWRQRKSSVSRIFIILYLSLDIVLIEICFTSGFCHNALKYIMMLKPEADVIK